MSIESKQFVVSPADIEKLTDDILEGEDAAVKGRSMYIQSMVGTIQHELDSPPRMRNANAPKLSEEDIATHQAALDTVYKRFHEAVLRAVKARMTRYDPDYVRSKTRFSVSAASTLRSYIRAGNDIRALAAGKVTKDGLRAAFQAKPVRRKFSVEALQKRAATLGEAFIAVARNLQAANRERAAETFRPMLATLVSTLGLSEGATRDPDKAMHDHVALQTRTGVLVPIDFAQARTVANRKKAA